MTPSTTRSHALRYITPSSVVFLATASIAIVTGILLLTLVLLGPLTLVLLGPLTLVLLGPLTLVLLGPPGCLAESWTQADLEELQLEGETIVTQIEAYYSQHGQYPKSLKAAGIAPPKQRYGGWRYSWLPEGDSPLLQLGDYALHGFTIFWGPDGGWYIDT